MEAIHKNKHFTYADYYRWNDGKRYELIDGTAYLMEPAPGTGHQSAGGALFNTLYSFLANKPGRVHIAPYDILLFGGGDGETTVLQPDIMVILDESIINEKNCNGAPDMVVEVLSPSTARHDKVRKFNQYLKAGVREYWIVDPKSKTVAVHILENGAYNTKEYGESDTVPVHVLEGCEIRLASVFAR